MSGRLDYIETIKRVQRPDDLVGTMIFLCSDDSDFITGQSLVCDGGGYMN